jgi:ankyrin repeat protein
MVTALIRSGAGVNPRDGSGVTPVMLAVQRGDSRILRHLHAKGGAMQMRDHQVRCCQTRFALGCSRPIPLAFYPFQ